ncbi:AAA family ATPase [Neiella marina]|uniref:AAA family ATPase n=1 Tax=Neiella holothuriorum TaxID=2870530 RepID=A0ABS7EHV4_9GAMM|nr:DEAD/DEAH box helicase [Neiella holothuriorum]MBW8191336.1 AAA family ATPase [Neiella holothuriorum]
MQAVRMQDLEPSPTTNSDGSIEITPEGQQALDAINQGAPIVFLTGKAGTGKTTLVKHIINVSKKSCVTVAPTGVAALNAGGVTINSFFRFPPRMITAGDIKKSYGSNVIDKLELLIVDEVSMVRADTLDMIDYALRTWRNKPALPFGGVQVLLVGDALQLPPVAPRGEEGELFYGRYRSPWFFDSLVIQNTPFIPIVLQKTFRQTDLEFVDALNRIRDNDNHRSSVAWINRSCWRDCDTRTAELTLTATNKAADAINQSSLAELQGPARTYTASTEGDFSLTGDRTPAPESLTLKVGAQVMILRNIVDEAVNGTLAVVEQLNETTVVVRTKDTKNKIIIERESWETYRYTIANGEIAADVKGRFEQLPLRLGWAVTIHKSQGLTLDSVRIDLGDGAFASGQTYVALSRCRSIQGLRLSKPIAMGDVRADSRILAFYRQFEVAQLVN